MADEGFSDDFSYAKEIANHLGVSLQEVPADPKGLERLPDLVSILEEPLADPAPLYVQDICAAAKADGVTVLLSGTGGDDVFAGYRRHQAAMVRQRMGCFSRPIGKLAQTISPMLAGAAKRRADKLGYMLAGDSEGFLHRAFEFSPLNRVADVLNDCVVDNCDWVYKNNLQKSLEESRGNTLLERLLFMEYHGFLPDHNLTYTDKAAMAESVEVRVPLIDIRLVDFAHNLPLNMKNTR